MGKIKDFFNRLDEGSLIRWIPLLLVPTIYIFISVFLHGGEVSYINNFEYFISLMIPLAILFIIHDILLVRQLYNKGKKALYLAFLFISLAIFFTSAFIRLYDGTPPHHHPSFMHPHPTEEQRIHSDRPNDDGKHHTIDDMKRPHKGHNQPPHDGNKHHEKPDRKHKDKRHVPGPDPLALDMVLALLLVISDFVVNLYIVSSREKKRFEALEHERLNNELQYLKAQLNPHFFMNTLNNIHGMVDIDQQKAQEMIMELSKLMRYVLYEGERNLTTLSTEVEFIQNYVALMRKRYSQKKVDINVKMPDSDLYGVKLPPLLFMVLIENAFKHGISYRSHSEITIQLEILLGSRLRLTCTNTISENSLNTGSDYGGIGLKNLRKRLNLLFGSKYKLDISEQEKTYNAILTIPYEYDDNDKVSGD